MDDASKRAPESGKQCPPRPFAPSTILCPSGCFRLSSSAATSRCASLSWRRVRSPSERCAGPAGRLFRPERCSTRTPETDRRTIQSCPESLLHSSTPNSRVKLIRTLSMKNNNISNNDIKIHLFGVLTPMSLTICNNVSCFLSSLRFCFPFLFRSPFSYLLCIVLVVWFAVLLLW